MFRLVNVGGRTALEHDGGWYDVARLAGDDSLATATAHSPGSTSSTSWPGGCEEREPDGRGRHRPRSPGARRPSGVRHRPQLPEPRRRERDGAAPGTPHLHQVPELPGRADRGRSALRHLVDWEAELVVVIGRTCANVPVARPGTWWPA